MTLSTGPDVTTVAEFETYGEAVEFCKKELDALANTANGWQDQNPMWSEYRPEDAFWNGGGDLKIEPGPSEGEAFNASEYFFKRYE